MPPQLNHDTFTLVLSLMDKGSLLKTMQANRYLYTEAANTLLKGPLTLDIYDENVLESFIEFANAEDSRRFRLFRSLRIAFWDVYLEQDWVDTLAECVRSMVGLRRLTLSWEGCVSENFLENPNLADAVSSLMKLEDLCLDHCRLDQDVTVPCIWELLSPLRNITLSVEDSSMVDLYEETDPVVLLSELSSSLEVIVTTGWTHDQDPEPYVEYPKVHSLTIDNVRCPLTARYARAFPNLTYLSLKTIESFGDDPDELDDYRSYNLQEGSGAPYWPSLKTYNGYVDDAYLLALGPRTLDRLELEVIDNELSRLTEVLCDVAPTHLSMIQDPFSGSGDLRTEDGDRATVADALRRGSGAASIRSLRLGFGPHAYKGWDALVWTFEDLLDAMHPLKIEEFVWETALQRDKPDAHPCFAKGREHDFPKHILERVPSLHEVRIVGKRWDDQEEVIRVTRAAS